MRKWPLQAAVLTLLVSSARASDPASAPALPLSGPSVTIDPSYPYYNDRSPQSVASEIRANGYSIVRCVVTAESGIKPALINSFHDAGIGVWQMTFANGTYSTRDLPDDWQSWKMVTRSDLLGKPLNDGYIRLCLNNSAYREWKKRQLARTLRDHPFQGIDIVEPHWPEYPGIESPAYACFCHRCRDAFTQRYPDQKALPDIIHSDAGNSPGRNPELWRKWLAFRKSSLTEFLNDLVNGRDGIRETAPHVKVCVWTLALSGPDGLQRVREDHGEDVLDIVRTVRPDIYGLQTHWPDWIKPDLAPDYVKAYLPYLRRIREADPKMPVLIQADTGSKKENRRDWEWIRNFERSCKTLGVESTTFYEYFIGRYMYTDPPRVAETRWQGRRLTLVFTKRLDPASAGDVSHYRLSRGSVESIKIDGNLAILTVSTPSGTPGVTLTIEKISDDADRRLFQGEPPATLSSQTLQLDSYGNFDSGR